MRQKKIVITGGGTGGHVFPAVSIAEELLRRGVAVHYVGSASGFEARHVPQRKIPFFTISSGAIKNQGFKKVLQNLLRVLLGYFQSLYWLIRWKPDAVIGVGGYVSVPVCLAALSLRIPVFLQEQNVSVGIANRFLGRFARKVFLGFEQARASFRSERALVTGNPIRAEFFEGGPGHYDGSARELLILGGSQGANAVNSAIVSVLDLICQHYPKLHIVHQTGARDLDVVSHAYRDVFDDSRYEVVPFIDDIAPRYRHASLVIARAGALTISEIMCVGRPAILVPYPRKGQNDQTDNARYLQRLGVAVMVEQGDELSERLWAAIRGCLEPGKLLKMHNNFSDLQPSSALATICDQIERI